MVADLVVPVARRQLRDDDAEAVGRDTEVTLNPLAARSTTSSPTRIGP